MQLPVNSIAQHRYIQCKYAYRYVHMVWYTYVIQLHIIAILRWWQLGVVDMEDDYQPGPVPQSSVRPKNMSGLDLKRNGWQSSCPHQSLLSGMEGAFLVWRREKAASLPHPASLSWWVSLSVVASIFPRLSYPFHIASDENWEGRECLGTKLAWVSPTLGCFITYTCVYV